VDERALVLPHDRHRLLTSAAAEHLRGLARRVVEAARAEVPLRAAILAGSAGRGDADYFSDLDLILYVDALPPAATLDAIRTAVGGTNPEAKEATEHALGQKFDLDGVRTELVFFTVERIEWRLEQLRDRPEEIDGRAQKALAGLLHGLPLYGDDLVRRWQERLQEYPEALRRLLVQRHWQFLPLWYHHDEIAARDAELWRIDALLDAAFNLLAVLAALNRIYFARVELKRTRALVDAMERAPADLADRLESLFRLEPDAAADELGRLVEETRVLVASEFPDLDFDIPFPPGTRKRAWAEEDPH
jgi:predicted nucleotidyltransferase